MNQANFSSMDMVVNVPLLNDLETLAKNLVSPHVPVLKTENMTFIYNSLGPLGVSLKCSGNCLKGK